MVENTRKLIEEASFKRTERHAVRAGVACYVGAKRLL